MIAGASAVQVGTANFINPRATVEIIEGIERYFVRHQIGRVADLVGTLIVE
jgi:dihydroorotate dehydrogenase (NAD+) catalytic subunit